MRDFFNQLVGNKHTDQILYNRMVTGHLKTNILKLLASTHTLEEYYIFIDFIQLLTNPDFAIKKLVSWLDASIRDCSVDPSKEKELLDCYRIYLYLYRRSQLDLKTLDPEIASFLKCAY